MEGPKLLKKYLDNTQRSTRDVGKNPWKDGENCKAGDLLLPDLV